MRDVFAELGLPPPDDVRLRPDGTGVTALLIVPRAPAVTPAQRLLIEVRDALRQPGAPAAPEMVQFADWLGAVEPENLGRVVKRILGAAGYAMLPAELRASIEELARSEAAAPQEAGSEA